MKLKLTLTFLWAICTFAQYPLPNPSPPDHAPNQYGNDFFTRYEPWATVPFKWCILQWRKEYGPGVALPAPKVHVKMTLTAIPHSGQHTHDATSPYAWPQPKVVDYQPKTPGDTGTLGYALTGADGCATFTWKGQGYAGWYALGVEATGQDDLLPIVVSTVPEQSSGVNYFFGAVDWSTPGVKKTFTNMGQMPANGSNLIESNILHQDTRHTLNSRYLTLNTLRKFTTAMGIWKGQGYPLLEVIRASLPYGGVADNQLDPNGVSTYVTAEWTSQLAEQHAFGNEIDVKTPTTTEQRNQLVSYLSISGCVVGRTDANGAAVSNPETYWKSQPYMHVTCDRSQSIFF